MLGMGGGASRGEKRGRGEGVKQQSLELRANYCNCNLDSKHRDTAVTGSHSAQNRQKTVCVCASLHAVLIVQ